MRRKSEQGFAKAQFKLGTMYVKGQGVTQDDVSAHMWFNIAGSNGHKNAVKNRGIAEKIMTQQQIEKAQEMARNWKPKT
ncbi:MAG: sel1 repeat family protein, partial [Nitrospinae bacterium]|nr:sel1 repeat family protein [Nitrospinota bacterium]